MIKCSPVEMRKNLQVVEQFRKDGVDFVPVPVKDADHKKQLLEQVFDAFDVLINNAETS